MDWNEINALLSIIHQAAAAGPRFQKWADLAAQELEKLWGVPPEPQTEPTAPADGSTTFTGSDPAPATARRI